MLKVWGRKSSSNVQALMWCIGELGLDYERIDAGFTYGVVNTPEYLAINPNATVPTLKDDEGEALFETGAIIRYLANRYGTDTFWPDDLAVQAQVDKWAEWSKVSFAVKFTAPIFWQVIRTAPAKQNPTAISQGLQAFNKQLSIADNRLSENKYLAGENFTLADIQIGHILYRYFDLDIDRKKFDHLERYYSMLCDRPAYQEHVMLDYEELRVLD
ncbi:MAG: glutathione S-transferase [Parasphingorhabdus sp.]|jgi:glutathione S-transferase